MSQKTTSTVSTTRPSKKKITKKRAARPVAVPGVVIGRVERVDLPEWHVAGLKAKIDTGARTSSVHVEEIEHLGRSRVRFAVVTDGPQRRWTEAKVVRTGRVKSSNGHMESRIFVETELIIGPVSKRIEVSLTGRADMNYRMLLGRLALEDDFLVDASQRFIAEKAATRGWRPEEPSFLRLPQKR